MRHVIVTDHAADRFRLRFPEGRAWPIDRIRRILRMLALCGDAGHAPDRKHGRIMWGDGSHSHCVLVVREATTAAPLVVVTVINPMADAAPAET